MMEIILISLLTLLASFIGTISGFGLSTVMLPVLIFFYSLPEALLFVGIIHAFSDFWKVLLFKHAFDQKIILFFGLPGIIASLIGARIVLTTPQTLLIQFFGLILLAYVGLITLKPKFALPHNAFYSSLGGTISGLLAGLFGMGGAVRSMFLSAFNFPKEVFIFASGAIGLIIDSMRLFTYYFGGIRLEQNLISGFLIYIPISFLGAEIAKRYVNKVPQRKFRYVVSFFLFMIGVKLLLFP